MEEKEIIQQLQDLHYTHAPKAVHEKIATLTDALPAKHRGFYLPLFAFNFGMIAAVILVCVLATSGVLVAAEKSSSGTPLYPVKVLMQKIIPSPVEQKQVESLVVPTNTPTPLHTQEISSQSGEKNEKSNIHAEGSRSSKDILPEIIHKSVKGTEDAQKEKTHDNYGDSLNVEGNQDISSHHKDH